MHTSDNNLRRSQLIYSASVVYFKEQFDRARRTSLLTKRPIGAESDNKQLAVLGDASTRHKYFESVVNQYRNVYRADEPPLKESAAHILDDVMRFSRAKSWLRQVDFCTRIATAKVKRSLDRNVQRKVPSAKI